MGSRTFSRRTRSRCRGGELRSVALLVRLDADDVHAGRRGRSSSTFSEQGVAFFRWVLSVPAIRSSFEVCTRK